METTLRNLCSYSCMLRTLWSILVHHFSRENNFFIVLVMQSQVNPGVGTQQKYKIFDFFGFNIQNCFHFTSLAHVTFIQNTLQFLKQKAVKVCL